MHATPTPDVEFTALVGEFFQAVSFEPGGAPSYRRIHDLFVSGGRLMRHQPDRAEIWTVEEFIEPRQAMVAAGQLTSFLEFEVAASPRPSVVSPTG